MRRSDVTAAAKIGSVADARELAERRLPKGIFQMFEAGSGSNATMDENAQAFRDVPGTEGPDVVRGVLVEPHEPEVTLPAQDELAERGGHRLGEDHGADQF